MRNRLGLPDAVVRAVGAWEGERRGGARDLSRFSVTELLLPPWIARLKRLHRGDEDVADRLPALFGTAFHALMEKGAPPGSHPEMRLEARIPGTPWTLAGRADLVEEGGTVWDWKTTTVKHMESGAKKHGDWRTQGLLYVWLLRRSGFPKAKEARFVAFAKDWTAACGDGTPPVKELSFVYSEDEIGTAGDFARIRAEAIVMAKDPCSAGETWNGTRCALFCPVMAWCSEERRKRELETVPPDVP